MRLPESFDKLADAFRNDDLRRLGFSYLCSLLGLWAYAVAVSVYAFEVGGAALVGLTVTARLVPAAIAAPLVAVLADRYSKVRVLVVCNLIRAVLIGAAAAAIVLDLQAAIVFLIAGVVSIVGTGFEPAKNSLLPELTRDPEELTAANIAVNGFESASLFGGPALAGLLLALAGVEVVFVTAALLIVLSTILIARIGAASEAGKRLAKDARLSSEVSEGFRAIAADWRLRWLVGLTVAQLMADGALGVLIVAASIDLLGTGEAGVGLLNAAVGVGALIGTVVTVALTARRGLGSLFAIALAGWGLPIALIGVVPEVAVAIALLALLGVANTLIDSSGLTLLQRSAPVQARGRVFGVLEGLIIAAIALGSVVASVMIETIGIRAALIATGLSLPALALISRATLKRIDSETMPDQRRLDLLRGIPLFRALASAPLEGIAASVEPVRYPAGSEIVRQGDEGERFYVIDDGEVEVFEDGVRARQQGPGDHFGEIALLRDVPRTATVVARTDVELLSLDREAFLDAVSSDALNLEAAEAVIATRLGSTRRR